MHAAELKILTEEVENPHDFRGLVAIDDAQELTVLATTEDCKLIDLFINGYLPEDNCVECKENLDVGLYEMRFSPWSYQNYEGDHDFGIDGTSIRKIGETPKEFSLIPSSSK